MKLNEIETAINDRVTRLTDCSETRANAKKAAAAITKEIDSLLAQRKVARKAAQRERSDDRETQTIEG